ncbi:hypothetical protein [Pseudomonas koreensis]|uniref:Uncharacterized protein n=1 Tax=Pseudomonas koreensis TaxID=198620 RepID=A0AA94EV41_9PSED|nr:hypothetical protein [Pseudomonas koreensis]RVD79872.1 hypothetical protein A9HBioS_0396 [Pseudomonas koreensis]
MSADQSAHHPLLRHRDGHPARVTFEELLYKREVYQVVAKSHLAGIVLLLALAPIAFLTDLLMVGTLTTAVLLIVSFVEWRVVRRFRAKQANAVVEH